MHSLRRASVAVVVLMTSSTVVTAQPPQETSAAAPGQVSFQFERPGLQVPKFSLTVDQGGNARYEADAVVSARGSAEADPPPTQHLDRSVTLSRQATQRIFSAAQALNHFNATCASNAKNIADTGTKTLRYTGEGGDGSCTYNYSQDKRVVQLTDLFQAIAQTLDAGRKLDFQHRFDRLGLDATIASLAEEVDSGRAAEVGTISPTLRSLVEDTALLQRVRECAARLLQLAQPPL